MVAYTETLKESTKELFELALNLVQQGHREKNEFEKIYLYCNILTTKMETKYNSIHTHIKTKYLVLYLATRKAIY